MSKADELTNSLESAAKVANAVSTAATSLVGLFTTLAKTGDALNGLSIMPNIPFPTFGGHVFWNELANVNGWRLQKNMFTGHCRILDPDDVRRAWGGEDALTKALRQLAK